MGNIRFKSRFAGAALLLALALSLAGCKKETPAQGGGRASAAFVENFGQPPTPEKGQCFARVGYFPLRSDPARVRAVPFFLFRETDQLQVLLDRLVGGEVVLPADSGLFNPFPLGTGVRVQAQKGNSVTLNLHFPDQPDARPDLKPITAALTETAAQFEGVEKVVILIDGNPLPTVPVGGFVHDPKRIAPVGPPVLFMVAGSWEKGSANPGEVVADFDRPVQIQSFHLEDAGGREIKGDYFQSVFNMSVVIHPENPAALREGMTLRARWDVTDDLGRHGQGAGEFPLQRHEHAASGTGLP
jgi:hypothetical protein